MEVIDLIEHEDGSATYTFDLTPQEHDAMCRNGIVWAIVCGATGLTVEEAMKIKHGWDGGETREL